MVVGDAIVGKSLLFSGLCQNGIILDLHAPDLLDRAIFFRKKILCAILFVSTCEHFNSCLEVIKRPKLSFQLNFNCPDDSEDNDFQWIMKRKACFDQNCFTAVKQPWRVSQDESLFDLCLLSLSLLSLISRILMRQVEMAQFFATKERKIYCTALFDNKGEALDYGDVEVGCCAMLSIFRRFCSFPARKRPATW